MILCRQSIEIAELQQLSVVQKNLKLPNNKFPETEIVAAKELKISTRTLGQTDGTRALRKNRAPIHVSKPRRREIDHTELDLPGIKALPLRSDAPVSKIQTKTGPSMVMDVNSTSLLNTTQAIDLQELDVFPDINYLPELAQLQH